MPETRKPLFNEDRRAQAMRENLQKRKDQARAREEKDTKERLVKDEKRR